MYRGTAEEMAVTRWRALSSIGLDQAHQFGTNEGVPSYEHQGSAFSNEAKLRVSPIPAFWLPRVTKRLIDSIAENLSENIENDGSCLSKNIARAAKRFFEETSDLLPSEPYIYSSLKGDLVAEFRVSELELTCIIGSEFVLAVAIVDSSMSHKEIIIRDNDFSKVREEIHSFLIQLPAGDHGTMDPKER